MTAEDIRMVQIMGLVMLCALSVAIMTGRR